MGDFRMVCKIMEQQMKYTKEDHEHWWKVHNRHTDTHDQICPADAREEARPERREHLIHFIKSATFNIFIAMAIIFNGVYVAVDELFRTEDNQYHPIWIFIEAIFTVIFMVECIFKIIGFGRAYFKDSWNLFDFALVWLAILGFAMSCEVQVNQGGKEDEAKRLRIARVFRLLRFLRIIRLFHKKMGADQVELVKFFSGNDKVDEK